jgi:Trk K+ transport system NAD-binding subunit
MIGKNIADLALPKNYAVQIIAMRDSRVSSALVMPRADLEIKESFSLLLVGRDRDLARLMED